MLQNGSGINSFIEGFELKENALTSSVGLERAIIPT